MWRDSLTILQPQGSVWQVPARGRRLFLVTSVSKGAEGPLVLEQDLLELLELCVFFGVHSLQVLHVLDHHFHSLAHPALLRHQGKQQLSATASCLEISPSSICSPLVPPWYERFSLLSFLSKLHYTPCPSTCPGFHFSRDCSCCKINKSVFSFPSPYNSASSDLWSPMPPCICWYCQIIFSCSSGVLHTTTPNIWAGLCNFP